MSCNMNSLVIVLLALLIAAPALANDPDTQAEAENIRVRREAVVDEIKTPLTLSLGRSRFTLSGLIEIEASLNHPEGSDEEDDLRLSILQIGLDAELSPWLGGHVIGLWEEEDTEPMIVDEAVISLTSPWQLLDRTPALHLGRQYLPFGKFESGMVSDPLTLELGEIHTTAALLALPGERWSATIGAFEGSVDNGDEGIDSWVAAMEVTPREGVAMGVSWISDLAETDSGMVQEEGLYRDEVAGWSAFVALQLGDFGLTAEYLAAVDRFKAEQVDAGEDLTGQRPQAWNLELSWRTTEKVLLVGRYEKADDYQADVRRYGAAVSYGLCDYVLLAVEYLHAAADDDDPAHTFAAQLAVEF